MMGRISFILVISGLIVQGDAATTKLRRTNNDKQLQRRLQCNELIFGFSVYNGTSKESIELQISPYSTKYPQSRILLDTYNGQINILARVCPSQHA